MAKKSRTPPPPRKVQAPKVRTGRERAKRARPSLLMVIAAVAGLVGLGIALALVFTARGGSDKGSSQGLAQTLKAAGCTLVSKRGTSRTHVHSLDAKIKYNTFPPSNGPHYDTPVIWNEYTEPVSQVQLVHNLEHGGVSIQYGRDVTASTVTQLRDFYSEDPNGLVLAPLPKLGDKIALAAWTALPAPNGTGHVATCSRFSENAFQAFVDDYRGQGPERFPVDALTPGS